jgi:arabinose-5-phosphate isomerase
VNALKLLQDKNITQVIVTEQHAYVGFLHIHDLLREGIV